MSLYHILPVVNSDHIECIMRHDGQFVCRGTLDLHFGEHGTSGQPLLEPGTVYK
jgi:hypothetical protein